MIAENENLLGSDFSNRVILTNDNLKKCREYNPAVSRYASALLDLNRLAQDFMFGVYLRGMRERVLFSNVRGQARCFRNVSIILQSYKAPGQQDFVFVRFSGLHDAGYGAGGEREVVFRGVANADNPDFRLLSINCTQAHAEEMVRAVIEDWKKLVRPEIEGLSDDLDTVNKCQQYLDMGSAYINLPRPISQSPFG